MAQHSICGGDRVTLIVLDEAASVRSKQLAL